MYTRGRYSSAFVPAGHSIAAVPFEHSAELEPSRVEKAAANICEKKTLFPSSPSHSSGARSGDGFLHFFLCFCPFCVSSQPLKRLFWRLLSRLNTPTCSRLLFYGSLLGVSVFLSRLLNLFFRIGAKLLALSVALSLLKSTALIVFDAAACTFVSCPATVAAFVFLCFFLPLPVRFRRVYTPAIIGTGSLTPQGQPSASASFLTTSSVSSSLTPEEETSSAITSTFVHRSISENAKVLKPNLWQPFLPSAASRTSWPAATCLPCSCCWRGPGLQSGRELHSFSMKCCSSCRADASPLGKDFQEPSPSLGSLQQHSGGWEGCCPRPYNSSSNPSSVERCTHAQTDISCTEESLADTCCELPSEISTAASSAAAAAASAPLAAARAAVHRQCTRCAESQKPSFPSTAPLGSRRGSTWKDEQPGSSSSVNRHAACNLPTSSTAGRCCPRSDEAAGKATRTDCRLLTPHRDSCNVAGAAVVAEDETLSQRTRQQRTRREQQLQLPVRNTTQQCGQEEERQHQRTQEREQQQQTQVKDEQSLRVEQQQRLQQEKQRQQLLLECPSLRDGFRPACWALQQRLVQALMVGAQEAVRLLPLFEFDFSLNVAAADRTQLLLRYLRHRGPPSEAPDTQQKQQQRQHVRQRQQQQQQQEQKQQNEDRLHDRCCGCRGIVFVLGGIGARGSDAHLQAVCEAAVQRDFCCYFLTCLRGVEVPICTRPTDLTASDDLEAALQVVLRDHCMHSAQAAARAAAAVGIDPSSHARAAATAAGAAITAAAAASAPSAATICVPASTTGSPAANAAAAAAVTAASAPGAPAAAAAAAGGSSSGGCGVALCSAAESIGAWGNSEACPCDFSTSACRDHAGYACPRDARACAWGASACATSSANSRAAHAAGLVHGFFPACVRPQCQKDLYFVAFSMGACVVTNFLGRLGALKLLLEQQQRRGEAQPENRQQGQDSRQQDHDGKGDYEAVQRSQQIFRKGPLHERQQQTNTCSREEIGRRPGQQSCETGTEQGDGGENRCFSGCLRLQSRAAQQQASAGEEERPSCRASGQQQQQRSVGSRDAVCGMEGAAGSNKGERKTVASSAAGGAAAGGSRDTELHGQQRAHRRCLDATSRDRPPSDDSSSRNCALPSSNCFLLSVLPLVKGAVTVSNVLCLESSLGFLDGSGSLTAWLCRQSIARLYKQRQWKEPCALYRSRGIDEGLIHLSQMASASSLRALDFLTHLSLCEQACSAAYYSRVRCVEALLRVPVPLLCLHALDDPVLDASLLCRVAAAIPRENPNITFAVTEKGGHALFAEDWLLLSRSAGSCYHARVAAEFIEAVAKKNAPSAKV